LEPQPAKQFAESLSGLIERVTFFNDDTGFAMLKVNQLCKDRLTS
jgi:hypothetical protein